MKKCLVWGTGTVFHKYCNVLKYYELNSEIEIACVTSGDSYYSSVRGYGFINRDQIDVKAFDRIIVAADSYTAQAICRDIRSAGADDGIIVPINAMLLPGFDFDKYKLIRENAPTIICPNCWGGLTYSALGLEFGSPFINMFLDHDDYLKLLKNLEYYMECPLVFEEMRNDLGTHEYPVAKCGDILLYFNHYYSFEEANSSWNRRKERINMDNIFVMFYDESAERIEEFLKLPYERKICFSPYEYNNSDVISISYQKYAPDKPLWKIVNDSAAGGLYDAFELFCNNNKQLAAELK